VGCARCHDHKYDPIKQKDFYSLFAYFNNVPEKGLVYNFGNEVTTRRHAVFLRTFPMGLGMARACAV